MSNICSSCQKPKATLECGVCHDPLCKKCSVFQDEKHFSFLPKIPAELVHSVYCHNCHELHVVPAQADYDELMARARDVMVFEKKFSKQTRWFKRLADPIEVVDCPDEEETLLRLGFLAARENHNAICDVEVTGKKVIDGAYQTSKFAGKAIPTTVDPARVQHIK